MQREESSTNGNNPSEGSSWYKVLCRGVRDKGTLLNLLMTRVLGLPQSVEID